MKDALLLVITSLVFLINFSGTSAINDKVADNPLVYNGQVVNPLLIYHFQPSLNERPCVVSIDFARANNVNTYFIDDRDKIDATTIKVENQRGVFSYTYLGITTNKIRIVRTHLTRGAEVTQALLFFSFIDHKDGNDSIEASSTLIILEKLYWLNPKSEVKLEGNKITIETPGEPKSHIEISTGGDNSSATIEDNAYPPTNLSSSTVEKDWDEADKNFRFHGKSVNPRLICELNGGEYYLSDGPTTTILDIETATPNKQLKGAILEKEDYSFVLCDSIPVYGFDSTYVFVAYFNFKYEYLGRTANGVHVVRATQGENQAFSSIYFIRFKIRKDFDCNGIRKDQLLICTENISPEEYGSIADITIKGNKVILDVPERENPPAAPYDTVHSEIQF